MSNIPPPYPPPPDQVPPPPPSDPALPGGVPVAPAPGAAPTPAPGGFTPPWGHQPAPPGPGAAYPPLPPSAPPPPPPGYGGGPGYYATAAPDESGNNLASWALGLAIVPCLFPLTTIGAIVLAILVLARGRQGRGKAIAALIVAAAWIALAVGLVATGTLSRLRDSNDTSAGGVSSAASPSVAASESPDPSPPLASGSRAASVTDMHPGDCMIDPALIEATDEPTTVVTVTEVACSEPHAQEAYAETKLAGPKADFPGSKVAINRADAWCYKAFEPFVGKPAERSKLTYYFYFPTKRSWSFGDRRILCLVSDGTETTVGTLRHSNR